MTVMVVAIGISASVWWRHHGAEGAAMLLQNPPYESMTETQRDAVLSLIGDVSLDRGALVALHMSAAQAESVLDIARTWRETHGAMIDALLATIDAKTLAVRGIERAIRTGPFEPGKAQELAVARQELATARAAYRSALAPLVTSVDADLSPSQESTWDAIETGHGPRMPIRMLDVTDAQRVDLGKAWRDYRRNHAAARTPQERSASVTAYVARLAQILPQDRRDVMDGYNQYFASSSVIVKDAMDLVLPVGQG
jgi:hypothetical protein